jgi:predicted GIY-YIG superfamily endonuclease
MPQGDVTEQQMAELGARYEQIRMTYFENIGDAESFLKAEMAFKRWTARADDLHAAHSRPADQKSHGKSTISFLAKKGWMPPIPR